MSTHWHAHLLGRVALSESNRPARLGDKVDGDAEWNGDLVCARVAPANCHTAIVDPERNVAAG